MIPNDDQAMKKIRYDFHLIFDFCDLFMIFLMIFKKKIRIDSIIKRFEKD